MTVTYSLQVSTTGVLTFLRVLFRWRGSVYKALWKELGLFLILFYAMKALYEFGLGKDGKTVFNDIGRYMDKTIDAIPLSFILGFYVTMIFNRWWQQFQAIAWPDSACLFTASYLHGTDDRSRLYRRTIARYLSLSAVLGLRMGSSAVKKRFPTMQHLIEAGIMTEVELKAFEDVPTKYGKQWVPCQWAMNLCVRARKENKINSDYELIQLITAINSFRLLVRDTCFFDWMSVPLIYTQVVTLAVYSFFFSCLMGRQHFAIDKAGSKADENEYFPFFTILQFVFYVGWLKVAQCMINPYGEDDDDFEESVNFIIDRNLQTGYVFADDNYDILPPLAHDLYWDVHDIHLPYTAASYGIKSGQFDGSAALIKVEPRMAELVIESPDSVADDPSSPRSPGASSTPHHARPNWSTVRRKLSGILHYHRSSSSRLPSSNSNHELESSSAAIAQQKFAHSAQTSVCNGSEYGGGDNSRKSSARSIISHYRQPAGSLKTRPLTVRKLSHGSATPPPASPASVASGDARDRRTEAKASLPISFAGKPSVGNDFLLTTEESGMHYGALHHHLDTIAELNSVLTSDSNLEKAPDENNEEK